MQWLITLETERDFIAVCRIMNILRRKGLNVATLALAATPAGFSLMAVVDSADAEVDHIFNFLRRTEGVQHVTYYRHEPSQDASFVFIDGDEDHSRVARVLETFPAPILSLPVTENSCWKCLRTAIVRRSPKASASRRCCPSPASGPPGPSRARSWLARLRLRRQEAENRRQYSGARNSSPRVDGERASAGINWSAPFWEAPSQSADFHFISLRKVKPWPRFITNATVI